MWCAHCQTEVAAEVAGDNRRIHCASCGQDIASARDRLPVSATQEARELLERWSAERIVDPYGPLRKSAKSTTASADNARPELKQQAESTAASPSEQISEPPKPSRTKRLRIDGAQSIPRAPSKRPEKTSKPAREQSTVGVAEISASAVGASSKRNLRIHESHAGGSPHFDLARPETATPAREVNWMAVAGQWLSYLGVLALTAGTGLVLLGYFRGPGSYVPTGWLVTMAGQMMLFLGVMTTFSTGMEQTTDTVSRKIDVLGERIIRIEAAATELRRPTSPAAAVVESTETQQQVESA